MAETVELPPEELDTRPRSVRRVNENQPLLSPDSVDVRASHICQNRRRLVSLLFGALSLLCLSILVITFVGSDARGEAYVDRRREDIGESTARSGTDQTSALTPSFRSSLPESGIRDLLHKKGKGEKDDKKSKKQGKNHHKTHEGKHKKHHNTHTHHGKSHGKETKQKGELAKAEQAAAKAKKAAEAAAKAQKKAEAAKAAEEAKAAKMKAQEKAEAAKAAQEAKAAKMKAQEKAEAAKAAEEAKAAKKAEEAKEQLAKAKEEAEAKARAAAKAKAAKAKSTTEDPFANTSTTETTGTGTSTQVTSTRTTTQAGPYECQSDLHFPTFLHPESKGIALDDTTFGGCPSLINVRWPNTKTNITSIRLFKAWDKHWDTKLSRHEIWEKLRDFVYRNNAKVLYGTMISCDEKQDDEDWEMVKNLMKYIGQNHVMGLAIGNELELLQFKRNTSKHNMKHCAAKVWSGGYFMSKVTSRNEDLQAMPGFEWIPLTTAMGGYVLSPLPKGHPGPFVDIKEAGVLSFLRKVVATFGQRWVFTWNIYPYFDPNLVMDGNEFHTCNNALSSAVNFGPGSAGPMMLRVMRQRMKQLTGQDDSIMWVGETGWSSPRADSLDSAVGNNCGAPWSAIEVFQLYYQNFLEWDIKYLDKGTKGADHAFFFTLRDSINFGDHEYFGLESDCDATKCKIQQE